MTIRNNMNRIFISVRGTIFETYVATLERFPDTLLGSDMCRERFYYQKLKGLVFDRNVMAFEAILFYYQSNGRLVRPPWMAMETFEDECRYFRLSEFAIDKMKEAEGLILDSNPRVFRKNTLREKIWCFLEFPESSMAAQIYALLSNLLILASICLSCVVSVPNFIENTDAAFLTELSFQIIFAIEFILRLLFAQNKIKFFENSLTVIDFLAIFPYFLVMLINRRKLSSLTFLRVTRTIRILRILRLSKHSDQLDKVLRIIQSCKSEVVTFLQCLLVFCCLFGSLEYAAERSQDNTLFISIPEGMWWALQTALCLGYGDIVPKRPRGKLIGGVVAALGALLLTVPLLLIGGKYLSIYAKTFSVHIGDDLANENSTKKKKGNIIVR